MESAVVTKLIKIDDNHQFNLSLIRDGHWNEFTMKKAYHKAMGTSINRIRMFLLSMKDNAHVFFKKEKLPLVVIDLECIFDEDIHEVCAKLCINWFPVDDTSDIFRVKDACFDMIEHEIKLNKLWTR